MKDSSHNYEESDEYLTDASDVDEREFVESGSEKTKKQCNGQRLGFLQSACTAGTIKTHKADKEMGFQRTFSHRHH